MCVIYPKLFFISNTKFPGVHLIISKIINLQQKQVDRWNMLLQTGKPELFWFPVK